MSHDVAVFHPGVQHSWQTARALDELGRLSFYATSILYRPDRWPYRIERCLPASLAARVHAELRRFAGPALDPARVETFGLHEWAERIAARAGRRQLAMWLDRWGNDRFGAQVARLVTRRDPRVLWGYGGSSLRLFESPAAVGRRRVLDRTIGDWRAYNRAMAAVHERWPEFFPPGDWRVRPARIEAEDREYEAADLIVTGSPTAAATVATHARDPAVAAKLRVLPYCWDEALFATPPLLDPPRKGPVRFLMLGQGTVRKGIHLALEAITSLPACAATLTLVGRIDVPAAVFARYADRVHHRPVVARADVPAVMARADVLLFPSYFEGSALSLLEGLASGLALIQSREAGLGVTPDTGLLLPELSVAAVREAMLTLIDDRDRLAAARIAAPIEAQRYSFARYRENVAAALDAVTAPAPLPPPPPGY